jgi:5-formyltetrahydrofolate cyclo-ligase
VAVDTQGYRLGYGGGFYDKYLISHPNYDSLTLAFEIQVVDYLPITSFDQKV